MSTCISRHGEAAVHVRTQILGKVWAAVDKLDLNDLERSFLRERLGRTVIPPS